jgi:hypothetical protein
MEDFIISFEHLDFKTKGMIDAFFQEFFISGLKDKIQSHVNMPRPKTWLETTKRTKEAQHVIFTQNKKLAFIPCPHPPNISPPATPLKVQKLTWA